MAKAEVKDKKGFKEALAELNKKYSRTKQDQYFISTGSLSLDAALGGGVCTGRITELIAWEGAGKCLDKGAYILTSQGYKTLEEIFTENDVPLFVTNKTIEKRVGLLNIDKEVESTTHFTLNGRRKTYSIKTRSGFEFIRTYKHPILSMSENGNLIWKWAGELKKGDYIVKKQKEVFGVGELKDEHAYAIGALIADGGFYDLRVGFTNDDPDVVKYIPHMEEMIGIKAKSYLKTNGSTTDFHFNGKDKANEFYQKFGLNKGVARYKHVPLSIRTLNKQGIIEFLKGFFDCESCIGPKGIEVCSASKELMYQIKLILTQFCINSFLSEKIVKGYEHNDYWGLSIYANDSLKFIEKIGSNSNKVLDRYKSFVEKRETVNFNTNFYVIPHVEGIVEDIHKQSPTRKESIRDILQDLRVANMTYYKLDFLNEEVEDKSNKLLGHLNFLAEFEYEEVESCSYYDEIPTFDFAMERTHTFEADGFINHNTTVCLHLVAEAQKMGKNVAYVDAEHALDKKYAKSIGVDWESLEDAIFQPMHGEEAFDYGLELIKTGGLDLLIFDSTSGMIPEKQLLDPAAQSHLGLHARLFASEVPKINTYCGLHNTAVVFISQIREKIGVIYGSNETTPAGNTLKFFASNRIDLRRSMVKEGTEVVSQITKFKTIKCKTNSPFLTGSFPITFGVGIDRLAEIMDLAISFDIIHRGGSWFSYGDTKIGQGIDSVKNFLKDNPEFMEEVKLKVIEALKDNQSPEID